ncbi:hypothetical protein T265_10554 [Opisthorchis viverrini]|uniref:Uncharacterized protein n=1 Tax=Opisthorchis viverrini TaxID=6198 RepID=A0A075A0U2_OPIVI|nr:hypothetical protein T265_10554 [Opisthorchis viverrini]KER21029.1 hypothetical protein T265_10554 [Opisthorchis viverrini]
MLFRHIFNSSFAWAFGKIGYGCYHNIDAPRLSRGSEFIECAECSGLSGVGFETELRSVPQSKLVTVQPTPAITTIPDQVRYAAFRRNICARVSYKLQLSYDKRQRNKD